MPEYSKVTFPAELDAAEHGIRIETHLPDTEDRESAQEPQVFVIIDGRESVFIGLLGHTQLGDLRNALHEAEIWLVQASLRQRFGLPESPFTASWPTSAQKTRAQKRAAKTELKNAWRDLDRIARRDNDETPEFLQAKSRVIQAEADYPSWVR